MGKLEQTASRSINTIEIDMGRVRRFIDRFDLFAVVGTLVVLWRILAEAWICDDAFHAFIMARNLVEGHGFVYNIGERVNASTCPFFTLVVAAMYAVSGNMYMTGIVSCVVFSTAAVWILLHKACGKRPFLIAAVTVVLITNKSFISFTTSGIENAMLFFLGAMFCMIWLDRKTEDSLGFGRLLILALMVGITAGTRMDTVLVYVPVCIAAFFIGVSTKERWYKRWLAGFLGLLPFIGWLFFSLYYYGFLFPNTAYAKLNTDIPVSDYLVRGLRYVLCSFRFSPSLIIMVFVFAVLSVKTKKKNYLLLALGVAAYFVYVVRIGGDFMVGRHFTLIFFVSTFGCADIISGGLMDKMMDSLNEKLVGQSKKTGQPEKTGIGRKEISAMLVFKPAIMVILFILSSISLSLPNLNETGIADERGYYYPKTSLDSYLKLGKDRYKEQFSTTEISQKDGGYLSFAPGILLYCYADGGNYFDEHGLGDALLARIPCRYNPAWRIGHMRRTIPIGYEETVRTGVNRIEDKDLAEYYDKLKLVISGNLDSPERLNTLIGFNLGKYDYLMDSYTEHSKDLEVYYYSIESVLGY